MSQVMVIPEALHTAAADLANIGLNVQAAHEVAAGPTTAIIPAAADEVSGAIAKVFAQHAAGYQALAGQASAFRDQFVQALKAGGAAYALAEATNAASLDLEPLLSLLRTVFSLVPPAIAQAIQNHLFNLGLDALLIFIVGFIFSYIAFGYVFSLFINAIGWGP